MFQYRPHPVVSRGKANTWSFSIFVAALVILGLNDRLWPEILLAFGLALGIRQVLRGRWISGGLSFLIFWGLAETHHFHVGRKVLIPVLLTLAGLTVTFREYGRLIQQVGHIDDLDEWEGVESDD